MRNKSLRGQRSRTAVLRVIVRAYSCSPLQTVAEVDVEGGHSRSRVGAVEGVVDIGDDWWDWEMNFLDGNESHLILLGSFTTQFNTVHVS